MLFLTRFANILIALVEKRVSEVLTLTFSIMSPPYIEILNNEIKVYVLITLIVRITYRFHLVCEGQGLLLSPPLFPEALHFAVSLPTCTFIRERKKKGKEYKTKSDLLLLLSCCGKNKFMKIELSLMTK